MKKIRQIISMIIKRLRRHKALSLVSLLVIAILCFWIFKHEAPTPETPTITPRVVTVALAGDLSRNSSPLSLLGTVTSRNEAVIRGETSGKITVYKHSGEYVAPGAIIAEFENSGERAAVLSASAAYDSAKAAQRINSIGNTIATINTGSSETALETVRTQTLNTIENVYSTLDDAVRTKTDIMFRNPKQRDARFIPSISDAKLLITLEEEHLHIEALLDARALRNQSLSTTDDLTSELAKIEAESSAVKQYLDDLARALTLAIPDSSASRETIEGWKTVTGIARSSVSGAISSVTATQSTLNASEAGTKIANENLNQSNEGSAVTAEAAVRAALGNLQSAQSRLEKTIVRSPIAGTINSLPVETGDILSPYAEIATVSNNGALEIIAFATEEDARLLRVGSPVSIEGSVSGIITRIGSALDPKTKKIEIRIGITKNTGVIVNGQSLRVTIDRTIASPTKIQPTVIRVPLSALKITPTGSVIFTVSASSTLMAHPVKEGALFGDRVTILEGIAPDMMIVVDARGLKEGQQVTITE